VCGLSELGAGGCCSSLGAGGCCQVGKHCPVVWVWWAAVPPVITFALWCYCKCWASKVDA
jgi:hypothetical protein